MIKQFTTIFILSLIFVSTQGATMESFKSEHEAVLNASIETVWQYFTTEEHLKKWMAPLVEVDWKQGGTIKTNYNIHGKIGDKTTIVNTILSYDPHRMISIKATGFPEHFPFEDVAKKAWSVFYFESISPDRTHFRMVGLGYDTSEKSQQMKAYFEAANQSLIDTLNKALISDNK
jgi:uncharacterized protein YndB with AHSA1/START domain